MSGKFQKGQSGNPAGRPPARKGPVIYRDDGWANLTTGIGIEGRDKREGTTFQADVITRQEALELWRGDDLAAKIIELPAKDMYRKGYEVKLGDDKEMAEKVMKELERLRAPYTQTQAKMKERAFGGAAIFPVINDSSINLALPLDETRIPEIRHLKVFEAYELRPWKWYEDINHVKHGLPEVYQFIPLSRRGTQTNVFIHESRLIIYPGIRVSNEDVRGVDPGWGDSVLTRVNRVLRDYNLTWAAAGVLIQDFSQAIMKVKGLAEILAQDIGDYYKGRTQAMLLTKSITNTLIMDADGEDYERKTTSLTGIPEMMDKFTARVSAAGDIPVTRLFGVSPGGLNATGESDADNYRDSLCSLQCDDQPATNRLVELVMLQNGGPTRGKVPKMWSCGWHPLHQESDAEKAAARNTQANTDKTYIDSGVLSPEEVAMARFGGDTYSFETPVDFKARELLEEAAPGPVVSEAQKEQDQQALALAQQEKAPASGPPSAEGGGSSGVRKDWDPDQPRDENGRWGDGAGGSFKSERAERFSKRVARTKEESTEIARINRDPNPEAAGEREAAKDRETFHRIEKAQSEGRVKDVPKEKLQKHREVIAQTAKHLNDTKNALHEHQTKAAAAMASLSFDTEEALSTDGMEISDEELTSAGLDPADRDNAEDYFHDVLSEEPEIRKARSDILKIQDVLDGLATESGVEAWSGAIATIDPEADVTYEDVEGDTPGAPGASSPAEYRAGLTKFRDNLMERAVAAQDALEALHERQAAAVAETQKALKAYEKSKSDAVSESEVDPEDIIGSRPDEDDDSYEIAEALISFESDDRSEGGVSEDIVGALKDAQRSTARMAKALARVTKRPSKIVKAKKK